MIALARAAAFDILMKVATTDAHSDELLRSRAVNALLPQDRALTTALVLGTLRWQIKLDAEIRALLKRPTAGMPPSVETALRLGAYQLTCMDRIPAHAAIGESVELAKSSGETFAAGMVNAVLRKIAQIPRAAPEKQSTWERFAHPRWMVERWARFYGADAARSICAFDQDPAAVCLRLGHPDAELMLIEEGVNLEKGEFLSAARRVVRGDMARSEAFRRGWIRIQEEGSQLIAELAGRGAKILDTCAAPGGKTAILAERNPGASITALDVSQRRLDAMRKNFPEGQIRFEARDAAKMDSGAEYDLILCDVPCTGTGTIARNPEIRFRVNEGEIARQRERQVRILSRALEALAPGGRLLYSTCSLEPEENEGVIAECCAGGFELAPLESELARLEREGAVHSRGAEILRSTGLRGDFLRTLPGVHRCDGFFAALMTRA